MNTVAIIQARMGSTRLPGKVLADIVGKPMLQRVIERVKASRSVNRVVVATTTAKEDDVLAEYVRNVAECDVYRGSAEDVLARFYLCAKLYGADIVIRATADDPLKDPQIIDKAASQLIADSKLDYCSNTIEPSYPEGLDIEAIRFSALERAYLEAELASEREHVTPYVWKNTDSFNALNFKYERDLKDWRWTVDRPEDLEFMRRVFQAFRDRPLVPFQDVIDWLDANPRIRLINSGIQRNEGYLKSIQMENK